MKQERLIRVGEVAEIMGCCKASIWNWLHTNPHFPRPKKLTSQITVWKLSEINKYIDEQVFAT